MDDLHVFDLHCDTVDALAMRDVEPYASTHAHATGDLADNSIALDLGRMAAAGAWAQCLAVWVPDDTGPYTPQGFYARAHAYLAGQLERHADRVGQVRDARDVDAVLASGRVAALLTVENGSPIGEDLGMVDELAADGVKMLTLTWNARNAIGGGSEAAGGLSPFGRRAIRALEDARIVVDVSHLNDEGFSDLLSCARRPFAASHSNARAVCAHPRNLTDDQFRAIRDFGGIVGLNYCCDFLREGSRDADEVGFDDVAAHVEHWLDLGGEEVIALGSDFDGCPTPTWLSAAQDLPSFAERLARRFGVGVARRLLFENARDFFVRNEVV